MRKPGGWRLFLAMALLGWMALLAQADVRLEPLPPPEARSRSHVPVPSQGTRDPQQLFEERLRQAKALGDLRKHIEEISGKDIDSLLKQLKNAGIDPQSPEFMKLVQEEIKRQAKNPNANAKLNPEEIDTLQRLFKDLFPDGVNFPDKSKIGKITPPDPTDPVDKGKVDPITDPGKKSDWVKTPRDQDDLDAAGRQMANFAKRLDGLSGKVRNSPALRKAVGDLSRLALENSQGKQGGLDSYLAKMNRLSKQGDGWFGKSWASAKRFEMPRLPTLNLPTLRLPIGGVPNVGVPGAPGISAGGGSGAWQWFIGLGLLVGAAVLLWKLLPRALAWNQAKVADEWRLGPWPVAPGAVSSRADLVRAFEYLSLLLLGRQARTWNHRNIAAKLGASQVERRQAATELASLYERARYTPADEPLPAAAVADFRRDLCLLAGVEGT